MIKPSLNQFNLFEDIINLMNNIGTIDLGQYQYNIKNLLGKGQFAEVYKGKIWK